MPAASNEEQFKFLISCIRYSNNGKVSSWQYQTEYVIDLSRLTLVRLPMSVISSAKALRKSIPFTFSKVPITN